MVVRCYSKYQLNSVGLHAKLIKLLTVLCSLVDSNKRVPK